MWWAIAMQNQAYATAQQVIRQFNSLQIATISVVLLRSILKSLQRLQVCCMG